MSTAYPEPDYAAAARAALDERAECIQAKRCIHDHAPDDCFFRMPEVCS